MPGKQLKVSFSNERLKEILQLRNTTLKEVSKQLEIPYNTLKYCSRHEKIMRNYLDDICKLLDISPDYLTYKYASKKRFKEYQNNEILDINDYLEMWLDQLNEKGFINNFFNENDDLTLKQELNDSLIKEVNKFIKNKQQKKGNNKR